MRRKVRGFEALRELEMGNKLMFTSCVDGGTREHIVSFKDGKIFLDEEMEFNLNSVFFEDKELKVIESPIMVLPGFKGFEIVAISNNKMDFTNAVEYAIENGGRIPELFEFLYILATAKDELISKFDLTKVVTKPLWFWSCTWDCSYYIVHIFLGSIALSDVFEGPRKENYVLVIKNLR